MNADMSVTTRQQISAQQRMRRLKNKIFLSAYRKGDDMTPEEEERGRRLQLARVKKNKMQRERYRRTAEEERKLKNVICERFAEEERKLKNVCLTVTDILEGGKVAGGSGAGLLETPTDLMNADMSVTTRQQISVQQCMRRLKNKIFLSAYRKGDEMTPEEEERGRRLQLARVKKNKMQRERYCRTAEEERKLKNVIRERFAEEERKLKNMCLTVPDICRIRRARKR
jgi:hypothetical protein